MSEIKHFGLKPMSLILQQDNNDTIHMYDHCNDIYDINAHAVQFTGSEA